jgi:transcriptional regulator with XRE-family HTH domain
LNENFATFVSHMSQGGIQERTGLLRAYTSRVGNGHVSPSIITVEKYALALDVRLYALFCDGPRRTEPELMLANKKPRRGAAKNQPDQYQLFVTIVAGLDGRDRAFFMVRAVLGKRITRRSGFSSFALRDLSGLDGGVSRVLPA